MSDTQSWQNRIVGYGEKPAGEFTSNPLNWRKHPESQRAAIRQVLDNVGWITGVIENQTTGNLIDGHLRVEESLATNSTEPIPFTKVSLSEAEEKKILLLLDPIGSMATADETMIRQLMEMVGVESESLLEALGAYTEIIPDFEPASILEQGKMDELNLIQCPKCKHEFSR